MSQPTPVCHLCHEQYNNAKTHRRTCAGHPHVDVQYGHLTMRLTRKGRDKTFECVSCHKTYKSRDKIQGHAKTCTEPLPKVYLDAAGTQPAPVQPQSHESIVQMAFHQAHTAAAYFVKVSTDPNTTKELYLAAQQTATDAANHAATISKMPAHKPPTPMITPPQSDHTRQALKRPCTSDDDDEDDDDTSSVQEQHAVKMPRYHYPDIVSQPGSPVSVSPVSVASDSKPVIPFATKPVASGSVLLPLLAPLASKPIASGSALVRAHDVKDEATPVVVPEPIAVSVSASPPAPVPAPAPAPAPSSVPLWVPQIPANGQLLSRQIQALTKCFDALREVCVHCWAMGHIDHNTHTVNDCPQPNAPGPNNGRYHTWRINYHPGHCYQCGCPQKISYLDEHGVDRGMHPALHNPKDCTHKDTLRPLAWVVTQDDGLRNRLIDSKYRRGEPFTPDKPTAAWIPLQQPDGLSNLVAILQFILETRGQPISRIY